MWTRLVNWWPLALVVDVIKIMVGRVNGTHRAPPSESAVDTAQPSSKEEVMGVFSFIGKIAGVAVHVVTKLLPLAELLKDLIPGLKNPIEDIEELVDNAGELADDFIDNHRSEFEAIRNFGKELSDVGLGVEMLADEVLRSADDDEVTINELERMKQRLTQLLSKLHALSSASDNAAGAIKNLNESM